MKKSILLLVTLSFAQLAACADRTNTNAVTDTSVTTEPVEAAKVSATVVAGETLLATAPTGWAQGTVTNTAKLKKTEYFAPKTDADGQPIEQTNGEKVVFESFADPTLPDPLTFMQTLVDEQTQRCEGFQVVDIYSGFENEYPTSVKLFLCPIRKASKKGQVTIIKGIQGNDSFYIVSRERQTEPWNNNPENNPVTETEVALWSNYLSSVKLCDSSNPAHPCPQ